MLTARGLHADEENVDITLANGVTRTTRVPTVRTQVSLDGRNIPTTFAMISGHEGTKTFLGADFIEDARLVLDLAGRSYHFKGEPQREFPFVEQAVYNAKVPTDAKVQTTLASMRPSDPLDSLEESSNP